MTINDGVASYVSMMASYSNTGVNATKDVADDSSNSNSTFSGISSNFDTVEISATGEAYQAQTKSEDNVEEVAKQGPPPNGGGKPPAGAKPPNGGGGKPPAGVKPE